jgi:uncharacterized protein involved in cysteine biosynthesis
MKKNKKKFDLFSILITVVILTVLVAGAFIFTSLTYQIGTELKTEANDMVERGDISSENANYSTSFIGEDLPKYSDNYVFWFFMATFIGLLLTGLYLDFEPSVMIIIFIFGSIAVLGAWFGAELNTELATDSEMIATTSQMPKTTLLMSSPYFPIFIFVGLVAMMVIMYSKKRAGEYQ